MTEVLKDLAVLAGWGAVGGLLGYAFAIWAIKRRGGVP